MKYPREIIERIRASVDIVEVVGHVVSLKRTGNHYTGLCPFHKEKTPSFKVFPESQNFHCFGCDEGGSVFDFVMQTEGTSFPDTVRVLADRAGIALPTSGPSTDEERGTREIGETLELATRHYEARLRAEEGRVACEYLKRRGLSGETAKTYRVGFAPPGWRGLLDALATFRDGPALERAGLAVRSKERDGHYDRFRNRILFPIVSPRGSVIGFGGRTIGDDVPKYLNTPETEVYRKSRVLYGLREARASIRRERCVVVVEGYVDVLALAEVGVENVVATCGTALTADHATLLARHAPEIVFVFDGDDAGIRAALKGFEILLPSGAEVRAVALEPGQDPDDLARSRGAEGVREAIAASQDIVDFFYTRTRGEPRSVAVERLADLIARVPAPLTRREKVSRASDWFKFDEATFATAVESRARGTRGSRVSAAPGTAARERISGLERDLVRVCLQDAKFWGEMSSFSARPLLRRFLETKIRPSVRKLLETARLSADARPASGWAESTDDAALKRLILEIATEGILDQESLYRTKRDLLTRLSEKALTYERDRLRRALNEAKERGNAERASEILKELTETLTRLNELASEERASM